MKDDGWALLLFGLLALFFGTLVLVSECDARELREKVEAYEQKQRTCPMCEGEGVVILPEVEKK